MDEQTCSVYVGAENGLFKGINTKKNVFYNFNWNDLNPENEIAALCWTDESENMIYVGQKNNIVKCFDCSSKVFVKELELSSNSSPLKSLAQYDKKLITAEESGALKVWNEDGESEQVEIDAGKNLCKMRQNPTKPHYVATGGEENELKVWDLQQPNAPVFRAKNVRNDFLDLRVPVWVTDMQFVPGSERIVTCTRHHHIRMYDPVSQRRPVITMEFENHSLMSLSLAHNENQVIVGSSRGRMALIDLRKKAMVCAYKGFAGSISCVHCHPSLPIIASCGLDRFLRLHDLNTKQMLKKVYLKSKLNCLLMRSDIQDISDEEEQMKSAVVKSQNSKNDEGDGDDKIWDSMKVIKEKLKTKKRLSDITDQLTGTQKVKNFIIYT